jgi:hypothetical protein
MDLLPHYRRIIGDTTLTYKTVSGLTHLLEVTPRNFARVPTAGGGASSSSSSLPFFSSSSSSASASASASTSAAAAAASDEWVLINQTQKARRYQPRAVAAAVAHRQQLRCDGRNELIMVSTIASIAAIIRVCNNEQRQNNNRIFGSRSEAIFSIVLFSRPTCGSQRVSITWDYFLRINVWPPLPPLRSPATASRLPRAPRGWTFSRGFSDARSSCFARAWPPWRGSTVYWRSCAWRCCPTTAGPSLWTSGRVAVAVAMRIPVPAVV